jgi:ADP-ribose pyrophosphatase YjhB (NUDIX family)
MKLPTHIVAAAGIVVNERNKILLIKDNRKGWLFPGGIVENKETITEALIREIKEETGIDVIIDKLFCISSNISEHPGYNGVEIVSTKVMFDFICRPVGGKISTSEENGETAWFKPEIAIDLIEAPEIKERYKAYINYNTRTTYLTYITDPEYKLINTTNF